jgi:hypothetical protein
LLQSCSKDGNLKPKRRPEKRLTSIIPHLDGELSSDRAGKRVVRQVGQASGGLIASGSKAIELEALFIAHEIGTVASIEKIARHYACIADWRRLSHNLR